MNTLKTTFLLTLLTLILVGLGWLIGGPAGGLLFFFLALSINLVTYWWSDKIVVRMYRGKEIKEEENPWLHEILERLSQEARIPKPRLYLLPLDVPNAFATGRNPKNACVAVTKGLLQNLNPQGIEGVLSHEISHIKNRDILISTIAASIAGAVMFIGNWLRWMAILGEGEERGGMNLIFLLLLSILAPLAALIVQLAISRTREYQADSSGARISHNPLGLANALLKIESIVQRRPLREGNAATSHLFIVNPFRGDFLFRLFSTHPPVEERVRRLRELVGRV